MVKKKEIGDITKREFLYFLKNSFLAFILVLILRFFLLSEHKVISNSMFPSLKEGDRVIGLNTHYIPYSFKKGDIVVFYSEFFSELLIKRIEQVESNHIYTRGDSKNSIPFLNKQKIKKNNIVSKPLFIYYPFSRFQFL